MNRPQVPRRGVAAQLPTAEAAPLDVRQLRHPGQRACGPSARHPGAATTRADTPQRLLARPADQRTTGRARACPKTVRNIHAIIHRALQDAVRWGYLVRNVAEAVDAPNGASPGMQVWTPGQLRTFLTHTRHDRLQALWLLVATTGMRRGELAGLRWIDVDLDVAHISPRRPRVVANYQVHESEPKTAKGRRSLALDPATVAALREHHVRQGAERAIVGPGWQDTGLVFTRPDGSGIHPDLITDWFKRLARSAGLPPIRLHDVRHSYATAALAAGIPAKVVSERLG